MTWVPGSAPEPPQWEQGAAPFTLTSVVTPAAASSKLMLRSAWTSAPRAGPPREPGAEAEEVAETAKSSEEVGEVFDSHLLATKTAASGAVSGVPARAHQTSHLVVLLALLDVGQAWRRPPRSP